MEIEITVRVRAIVPDGLHLPRLGVDKNLDIPLEYLEGALPPVYKVGVTPKILTVQYGIRESDAGNMFKPLDDVFTSASRADADDAADSKAGSVGP